MRARDIVPALWYWEGGGRGDWERDLFAFLVESGSLPRLPPRYRERACELGLLAGREEVSDRANDRGVSRLVDVAIINESIREGRRHGRSSMGGN